MQFFHMRDDETKSWHNYLVLFRLGLIVRYLKLSCWALIRKGRPYVVFDYGGTICLSETFGSGETLGDKLTVGDVLTVILTDKPQDKLFLFSKDSLVLNFGLEEVIVYPFTYNKEMEEIYDFYKHYANLKDNKTNITIKKKSKRLSLR